MCVFCLCVFAVTVFLWSEWMSHLSQEKEHPSRIGLLQWFMCRCLCAECTDLSEPSIAEDNAWICQCLLSSWQCWHLDENTQCWLTTFKDQSFPRLWAYLQRSNITCFCKTQLKPPPFSVSRHHRKKPNVCLLTPVFTSSLPPLSQSSSPVFAEPARTNLHAAVQRQPQRLQPYKLPWLLSWSVLPAADRTDQRDSQPRGQRPLAVCCQGLGVLHSGSKGKGVVSLKLFAFGYVKKMLFSTTLCLF